MGLFPFQESSTSVHVKRRIAVGKSKEQVVVGLEESGYVIVNARDGAWFMRTAKRVLLDEALKNDESKVAWVE